MKIDGAKKSQRLPFRQVHLDFHTHGTIEGVGALFDERDFAACLKSGKVDGITLFAKCHHGWSYYETSVGIAHPHLKTNLLDRQINVCRDLGIRFQVYLSAGYDEEIANKHPDWIVHTREGPLASVTPFFRPLRFNSPYLDYLAEQAREVVERWPDAGGIFFDIIKFLPDFSSDSLRAMEESGLSPDDPKQMEQYCLEVLENYYRMINGSVFSVNPAMAVFHNSGHIRVGNRWIVDCNSHLEVESLPTGGWGYDHFPLSAAYVAKLGKPFLGMTGKFHGTWGEFGGFKKESALRYECSTMLATGASCSIGDQLHPSGKPDPETYRLIGAAYQEVACKEAFVRGGEMLADIAIYSAEVDEKCPRDHSKSCYPDEGAARMLLELHQPFAVLDQESEWEGYKLVILPDSIELNQGLVRKIGRHLENGGKILASGVSLVEKHANKFAFDVGAEYEGISPFNPEYIQIAEGVENQVGVSSPIVIHGPSIDMVPVDGEVLARKIHPYFNRTWEHFCGHQHAPPVADNFRPALILKGGIAYFSHSIFTRYRHYGQILYRDFVELALRRLLGKDCWLSAALPKGGRVYFSRQKTMKRDVLHLIYGVPSLKGGGDGPHAKPVEVIEDEVLLRDVACSIPLKKKYGRVRIWPQQRDLPVKFTDTSVEFVVPEVRVHQVVTLEY